MLLVRSNRSAARWSPLRVREELPMLNSSGGFDGTSIVSDWNAWRCGGGGTGKLGRTWQGRCRYSRRQRNSGRARQAGQCRLRRRRSGRSRAGITSSSPPRARPLASSTASRLEACLPPLLASRPLAPPLPARALLDQYLAVIQARNQLRGDGSCTIMQDPPFGGDPAAACFTIVCSLFASAPPLSRRCRLFVYGVKLLIIHAYTSRRIRRLRRGNRASPLRFDRRSNPTSG